FFSHCHVDHLDLHSFPTRRSSDLTASVSAKASAVARLLSRKAASISSLASTGAPVSPAFTSGNSVPTCAIAAKIEGEERSPRNLDRKSTRLNSSHVEISYAVFCLK